MKLTRSKWLCAGLWVAMCGLMWGWMAHAQGVSTTTVQGTVFLANGQPGSGTLTLSWPAFTTANNQAVTAGRMTVAIASDGFLSVNLAPNQGATPAGLFYTAIYDLSDGTTSTEYWIVPAAAQASLGAVRAQVMPAAQAVQAVSKSYVDQAITQLTQSLLTASGGTLGGPLYLSGDPTQPLQAADKHYVDTTFAEAVPIAGGGMTGSLTAPSVNGVGSPAAGSAQTSLQTAVNAAGSNGSVEIPPSYAGTDTFTNPNGVYVADLRTTGAQQYERSVKEFGAVCDGSTDDTNALQAALNYAKAHGVALSIPQGTCKTHTLNWHGESIGGMSKQVSALMGFPGQDVLLSATDSPNLLAYSRLHDLTIYVDQSVDASCTAATGRAAAGSCLVNRPLEANTILSPGGSGLTSTVGTGSAWAVGNCALAMPALTGAGGNGLQVAQLENLEIIATGADPMAQYAGAHSTHTCGLYLAQWPKWSEFRNIDIRGLNTGIALPALTGSVPSGLSADSNRWQNITIQATHGITTATGSNNMLDNVVASVGNSAATGETPTGLVLDLSGNQQGWTVRNAVVIPKWNAVQPTLTITALGGAVTGVTVGTEHGLGFDPYGAQVPLAFSGSCTALATASVNRDGSIGAVSVTQGGVGCSGTTTASVNVAGTWDTAAAVNLIGGQNMTLVGGNLLNGNGGYTVWNASASQNFGTLLGGPSAGGGNLPGGGTYGSLVANHAMGTAYFVETFPGTDFGSQLQACLGAVNATYGGTCDARNFTGSLSMGSNLTISTANTTVLLPCATIATVHQIVVTAGTRNVALRGCALRGSSNTSGSQGGTVFLYSGASAMVQVGDPTYAADTQGFHLDNVAINTTSATSGVAQGVIAYRTQEMDLESLYFLGNSNQTGITLDGTGNYTGGTFYDDAFNGFQTAVHAVGHQVANAATTDWMNASTFVRLHIDCPTSGGSPISGTYGINLQQGDGNTFTGGDVEGCATALHLGTNAQNNTIVGLRNENSSNQVVADTGSSYNNWMTGGTMFTGALTDNGTRNSFLDTFHRSFNGIQGDWYGSQQDATVTNHYRIGTGQGNERGLLNRYQTDYGYRWTTGLSDATAGEQFYQVLDELNSVYRLSIGQYNNGQASTNNQTAINAAGSGAVVVNGSNNAGTGGVVFGSGGPSETTVATIDHVGNAQFNGAMNVGGVSTFVGSTTVKNQADGEIDASLWAGATTSQKESFVYKDWNGNSQWFLVKDAGNNWALNSATGGLDSFKAYQSTNSGDTYVDASNTSGAVRINYETGSGTGFNVYGGNSSTLYASFTGTTAIKFPGLAASIGHNCLQIDNSGYITNTGAACGTGSSSGTVGSGSSGQIAYYSSSGTALSGISSVPVGSGGTGATTTAGALANLGALPLSGGTLTGSLLGPSIEGGIFADQWQSPSGSGNNGIAMSAAQCASMAYVCEIQAPALYAETEQPAWSYLSQANGAIGPQSSTTQQLSFWDMRGGSFNRTYIDPVTSYAAQGEAFGEVITGKFTRGPISASQRYNASITSVLFAYQSQGGLNSQLYGFNGKTTVAPLSLGLVGNSVGQKFGLNDQPTCQAAGDCVGIVNYVQGPAGFRDPADEGTEIESAFATETINVYRGSISSSPSTGATSLTIAPAAATGSAVEVINGTQGEGRWMLDTTSGKVTALTATAITDSVQQFGSTYGYFSTVTAASGITTSSAYGTLTAAVSVASNAQTPGTQTISYSVTGTLATGIACIGDEVVTYGTGNYEAINITAVAGGLLTAEFQRPHPSGAAIFQGGQCGRFVEIVQDTYPAGSAWSNGESGGTTAYPVRHPWPVLGSIDGTHLIVWTARAFFGGFWSNFSATSGSQTVNLYPGAEVYKVAGATNDTTDNQFGLAPNNAAWANGDSVEESHYPSQYVHGEQLAISSFGENHVFGTNGLSVNFLSGAQRADAGVRVSNNTVPYTSYIGAGGLIPAPYASFAVDGTWGSILGINGNANFQSVVGLPCMISGCSNTENIVEALGPTLQPSGDAFSYLPNSGFGTTGSFDFWNGGYSTAAPRMRINSNGIQMNNSAYGAFPQFSTVAYSATNTTYEGVGHGSGGLLNIDSYAPTFGESGIGIFVDAAPNSTSSPTNLDYSIGRQGLFSSTNKCFGWGPTSSNAGNPSNAITPSESLCYSNGGIKINTAPPNSNTSSDGVLTSNCVATSNCTYTYNVLSEYNALNSSNGNDIFRYDPIHGTWVWTAGATNGDGTGGFPFTFSGATGMVSLPSLTISSLAGSSGNCLQIASGGSIASSGSPCGTGSGAVTSFAAPAGSWPSWLVPTVTSSTTTPSLAVAASAIPNAALTNAATTVAGQTCTLGSSCAIAATNLSNGVSGSGAVALVGSPTFTGNTTTFANGAASEVDLSIQAGSGADQVGALEFNSYSGTDEWKLKKDSSNYLRLTDVVNSLDREVFYQSGETILNAGAGSSVVGVNNTSGSGTGGLIVYGGGANYATAEFTATGSGNTTANGFVSGKFLMGAGTMTLATGSAAGTSPTIACASGHVCDGVSGTVTLTTGTSTAMGTLATLSFPNTHSNNANCVVTTTLSGAGQVTTVTWSESTTAVTLTANAALTASTAYQIRYWCGGN